MIVYGTHTKMYDLKSPIDYGTDKTHLDLQVHMLGFGADIWRCDQQVPILGYGTDK